MKRFKFNLGEILKDNVTGFKGAVMARSDYFTGCRHYGLQAQTLKDGKPLDWEWIDEVRLIRMKNAKKILPEPTKDNGGPAPNAPQIN